MKASVRWIVPVFVFAALGASACDGSDSGAGSAASGSSSSGGGGMASSGSSSTSTSSSGGDGGAATGPFSSSAGSSYETQTSLAADAKGNVVAVWIGFAADNTSAIGYAVSRDGGAHWAPPKSIPSPDGRLASNPVIAVDSQSRFTLAWLGFRLDFNNPDEHIYVSRLDDASGTFNPPVVASDDDNAATHDVDKPAIKVDASDDILLSWADFTGNAGGTPASLQFARSSDGKTFTRVLVTNDNTFGNLASLCLDPALGASAPLYMVHLGANGAVSLRVSADKGQSWQLRPTPATQALFQDITCVASGSDLWIAYADGTAPFVFGEDSPADAVHVMHSGNGGQAFDAPVKITSGAVDDRYLYPQLARSPSGKLEVVYYQGAVGKPASFVLASSTNGAAWTSSPVAMPGTFTVDRTIASWLGGYVGLAIPATTGLTVFAENTQNKSHIQFAEIALP